MTIRQKARGFRAGLLVAGVLGLGATAALAQEGGMSCPMMGGGMGMMGRGMGMGMMGGMRGMGMGGGMMGGGMGMMGRGRGMGMMAGGGMGDMAAIHTLFSRSDTISRSVKLLPDGIEAVTESSDPKIAALLPEHVAAMKARLEAHQPIRQGDPLFAAIFENADKIKIVVTSTPRGVKVVETSDDPYTIKLLQSHARAVSDFVRDGMAGMHTFHPAPPKP